MPASIFSPYQGPENRVTSAILAVLRSVSIELTEMILSRLLGDDEFSLIQFQNQAGQGGQGVPDAQISSNINVVIETKLNRNTVDICQIWRHLERIKYCNHGYLLILTPHDEPPQEINECQVSQLRWNSFGDFDQIIGEIISDADQFVSERDDFLLRNLRWLFADARLDLLPRRDVCIVAASKAWPHYCDTGFYRCQRKRSFRPVERFGFYAKKAVQPKLPKVLKRYGPIQFSRDFEYQEDEALKDYVRKEVKEGRVREGEILQFFKLSKESSEETKTVNAGQPICHHPRGAGDAFTQGQRYVRLERFCNLSGNATTADLIDRG